jgi:predicted amidohydrolase YtcJ
MHAALAREPWAQGQPNEAQELAHTLAAYTRDAAFAEHQETVKGQLREGMLADLVLLSDDIAGVSIDQVKDLSAALTICAGKLVHHAL